MAENVGFGVAEELYGLVEEVGGGAVEFAAAKGF